MQASISVLGAGSWGTALAILAARNGCQTLLWGHDPSQIQALKSERQNRRYLPNIHFPDNLQVTASLIEAIQHSDILLIAAPSHAFRNLLRQSKPYLNSNSRLICATKGFDPENEGLLSTVVSHELSPAVPVAIISGPSFAMEVASNLPTAIAIASQPTDFAEQVASMLLNAYFRAYTHSDIIGMQVGGAVKNVLAIAAGIADGLGFGANTRSALKTRGLTEIMRLELKLGGKQETFMGLSGLGDLILTCTDNQSRNRRFGLALGQGQTFETALANINQEVEGIFAAKETYKLAQQYDIDMPIVEQTFKVLYEKTPPLTAVKNLLGRDQKAE